MSDPKADTPKEAEVVKKPKKNGNTNGNGINGKTTNPPYDIHNPPTDILEKRLKAIVRHITHVQQSCTLLGERLVAAGESTLGHRLIANGFIHDNSKFHGIEWKYLHDDVKEHAPELFQASLLQHTHDNEHHPECWDGITNMPRLYIAEMVCDWHARSSEFGTGLREFIKNVATKKFEFTVQSKVYREIKFFVDILLDPGFS